MVNIIDRDKDVHMTTPTQRTDLFDILTVFNPSSSPFEVYYNSELHKIIPPGKAVHLVKMIGEINIEHLIDRMCRQQGVSKNDPNARAAWRAKIVLNEARSATPIIPSEIDLAKQAQQQADIQPVPRQLPIVEQPTKPENPEWKFDPTTGEPIKPKVVGITPDQVKTDNVEVQQDAPSGIAPTIPTEPPAHPDEETNQILNTMRSSNEERSLGEQVINADETPVAPTANRPLNPSREDLMDYAKNVLMMNTEDPTTKAKLEAMDIETLKKEIKYDPYA